MRSTMCVITCPTLFDWPHPHPPYSQGPISPHAAFQEHAAAWDRTQDSQCFMVTILTNKCVYIMTKFKRYAQNFINLLITRLSGIIILLIYHTCTTQHYLLLFMSSLCVG